ncbi:MAG: universal stress protein [Gemmatimonadales bacterium]
MELRHIVVATDESDAGRRAVQAGMGLAQRAGARITIMRAVSVAATPALAAVGHKGTGEEFDYSGGAMERLQRWLEPELSPPMGHLRVELGIALGSPGIEICRFAEDRAADLLILGRKQRSQLGRLLLGDTADAVTRRSRIPCLSVARNTTCFSRILVALDGIPRGLTVLHSAANFAECSSGHLRAVTVEPELDGEASPLSDATPSTRSEKLREEMHAYLDGERRERIGWPGVESAGDLLEVRRGEVVNQVLLATEASDAEVLVFGYHRGGPPGIIEAGSTSRRLAHMAPCSVLTIPL